MKCFRIIIIDLMKDVEASIYFCYFNDLLEADDMAFKLLKRTYEREGKDNSFTYKIEEFLKTK